MTEWRNRPLDRVYPVLFIDAIVVKVRDGQVVNRPVYVVIGVTVNGERDILGLWAGDGGEGAKFWLAVLTEIKNRGVEDVCLVVCDGLKGLPESITTTWSFAQVQTCILHLIRNTFRYAGRQDWDELARDLRPVYTAVNAEMAAVRFEEFADKWATRYPAIIKLWRSAWEEFIPFLDYDVEITEDHLQYERRRKHQPPLPASRASPGTLPDRPGRLEMPLPGHPLAGSHRAGQDPLGDPLEARAQRLRDHLRRPYPPQHRQLTDHPQLC
jgi:transposase-like protein